MTKGSKVDGGKPHSSCLGTDYTIWGYAVLRKYASTAVNRIVKIKANGDNAYTISIGANRHFQ